MLSRALTQGFRRRGAQAAQALASTNSKGFATAAPKETSEYFIYPRTAPGLDVKLNWSLAADDITPAGDAYRNAAAAVLNKGKGKAPGSSDVKILEAGASVPFETFDAHLADVKATLETGAELYVEDGTTKGSSAFGVRVIADSPAYAQAAKSLLEQGKVGWPFHKAVTVYASAGAKPFGAVQFESTGGDAGKITGATVALGGAPASAVKNALSMVGDAMKA